MGITIPVYLHFVSFIRSFFQNFFQSKDHEEPEDVRLFGDRNPRHFVRRRSGIETDGRRGNFVERGDGNRPTQRKRRGGIARGGNISRASQASRIRLFGSARLGMSSRTTITGIDRGGNISQASQASLKRSRNGRGQKASRVQGSWLVR